MAALASSAVSLYPDARAEAYPRGKGDKSMIQRKLLIVLTGQGGQTNTIGAAALGLGTLTSATALWDATNSKGYPTVVDPVNNILILLSGADPQAPVDVTTTAAYVVVNGTPKVLAGTYP